MFLTLPTHARIIPAEALLSPGLDAAQKRKLADVALNAAKSLGATYTDVRIGRYLNQFITTRENKVQNIVNSESFGVGIRVIVNGTWGFASTNTVNTEGIQKATQQAIAIAKANSKFQKEPVKLAPQKGYGEVTWKTPIGRNAFEVPVSEKAELLLAANAAAMQNGASYVNSNLFQVNEQKYFASSEGSYIDQDIHRIWPTFTVTAVDKAAGTFKTRQALSAPMGKGYEYMIPKGANSGFYLRGRYELQIFDDFESRKAAPGGNGAIYSFKPVSLFASRAPGEWQQVEATIQGNRVTVILNGVKVHDNVEVTRATGGELDANLNDPGPILLQGDHGSVAFRNIRIKPLK